MHASEILSKIIKKIDGAYAPSTIRAYKANFQRFIEYCETISASPLPSDSETIAKYIKKLTRSNLKAASIRLAVASISAIHKFSEFPDPTQISTTKIELKRMHRVLGRASKQAFGITAPIVEKMIAGVQNDLRGLRDKALLLLAYESLCRRSELVSLRLDDIQHDDFRNSMQIRLRKSKADQEAIGKVINLSPKVHDAIVNWVNSAKIKDGFIFRGIKSNGEILHGMSPGQINRIYKSLATKAGIAKEKIINISGHSMRVGAAQDIAASGASLPTLMHRGRWSKPDTAIRYIENTLTYYK